MDERDARHPDDPDGADQDTNLPAWLDEFETLANDELSALGESSCEQVHPVVERWYEDLMEGEPPPARDSIMQAMACLSTEILNNTPEDVLDSVLEHIDEDTLVGWVEYVLMVGRAFEIALQKGKFDDL